MKVLFGTNALPVRGASAGETDCEFPSSGSIYRQVPRTKPQEPLLRILDNACLRCVRGPRDFRVRAVPLRHLLQHRVSDGALAHSQARVRRYCRGRRADGVCSRAEFSTAAAQMSRVLRPLHDGMPHVRNLLLRRVLHGDVSGRALADAPTRVLVSEGGEGDSSAGEGGGG